MTAKNKLELIESIWADLRQNPEDIPSPDWHRVIPEEREKAVKDGRDKFIDFEEAIDQINTRLGIWRGIEDVKADRVQDAEEFFDEMFAKYDIPWVNDVKSKDNGIG